MSAFPTILSYSNIFKHEINPKGGNKYNGKGSIPVKRSLTERANIGQTNQNKYRSA